MSSNIGAAANSLKRDFAVYHPKIWADNFLNNVSPFKKIDEYSVEEQHDELKQDIGRMLKKKSDDNPSQKLKLIDLIQRLGISYHFKAEIEDELEKLFCNINSDSHKHDLHNVALRFRLLRQQGIKVSCDVFEDFKDSQGKFKKSLIDDVEGMLSLYEASFLSIRGEDILDEALAFTTANLKLILPKLSHDVAEDVAHALIRPIRKCFSRLEARRFIPIYERDESHDKTLLTFAKLDFNMLQEQHQKELNAIIQWWKNLNVPENFPYVRDRVVELYFWIMGVYFEPQYYLARKMLTKVIALATILDDTYDNFATTDELQLLTDAIQRWDVADIDTLPEYMKVIFHNLNDVYNEIDEITSTEGRSFCVYYAKESMKKVVQNYLAEAKWREQKYTPTMEEYMQVSLVTTCYSMLTTTSFLGMGEIATKDAFEWIFSDPKIIKGSTVICRFMDDIVSHKFEQKREHVASGVECYVKQYNVSEEEIVELFRKEITHAWKDINEECLKPFPVSMDLLERILNLSRAMDVIYKDDDGFTNSHILKDSVASLLKDPLL
ncbi:Alpha-copaene synthase [Euphorbia peplus]|nr:Alpha-copaene synthase [Euphorbia peplus]